MNRFTNIWFKQLKASTLVEVITALTIISLTSGIFMAIIFKAGNHLANRQKQYAMQQIIELSNDCRNGYLQSEEEFTFEGFTITRRVSVYRQIPGLWLVQCDAFTADKKRLIHHNAVIEYYGQPKSTDE